MNTSGDFFLEFMEPLIGGLWEAIKAIGHGIFRMFNVVNYIEIVNKYKTQGNVSIVMVILAVVCLLLLFGLLVFLIYRGFRRFTRYRHNAAHQEALVDEIESLNNDIII